MGKRAFRVGSGEVREAIGGILVATNPHVSNEIDVGDLLVRGWHLFSKDAGKYIAFIVVVGLLPALIIGSDLWSIVTMVIPIFEGSFIYGLMRSQGKEPRFADAFLIFNRALPLLLVRWVSLALITLGFFALVIPGIYLAIAYLLVIPLVLDRNFGVWQSLEASRQILTRQWFRAFLLMLVVAVINLIGMIPAGLGLLITGPLTTCVIIALYETLFGTTGNLPYGRDQDA